MAQHCFRNEYFDSLLQSCIPCQLRCSSKPPFSCQSYCNESTTGQVKVSDGILWIGLGIGVILTLTVFILMVLFKMRHPKQSKEELKNTESAVELNIILKADTETSVNTDIIGDSLQSEASLMYSEEECTCGDCGLVKLQTGFDTSFPLPATEEGATVLVTTKTSEYCSYIPGAMMTL
ncbi:tumor necrosis factor receptor superfamily member 17 [Gopherus flavomarginatus]|uniref:tumor necrosis factor receptor superfamily member 17 n=1 Tax=Gopherus flavomarginatus TaxID=286002 RepID=UPI0021CBCE23|nr:tumor necrosis factor receptor superfamily member 17 [Gopherus flavomarginatus]XP_050823740.1 tumor necrosis factor receptor superfamily member 17 [Gopherus flavomarginatus]XP_050823741.1 tumor necrosis factor receptor superfamily member 17 [Gopherus flavomarginatus]XP_050823742.1 tumor necrosis factor receptor superfamily member 17 [Gopherus flavomarginatus]